MRIDFNQVYLGLESELSQNYGILILVDAKESNSPILTENQNLGHHASNTKHSSR
jgi:hypothetical protein